MLSRRSQYKNVISKILGFHHGESLSSQTFSKTIAKYNQLRSARRYSPSKSQLDTWGTPPKMKSFSVATPTCHCCSLKLPNTRLTSIVSRVDGKSRKPIWAPSCQEKPPSPPRSPLPYWFSNLSHHDLLHRSLLHGNRESEMSVGINE
jgi:hypothetical protein